MNRINKLVAEFQDKFETPDDPTMWAGLIEEETEELMSAFVNVMKELADLNYVIAGYANVLEGHSMSPGEDDEVNYEKLQRGLMALDIIEFWLMKGVPLPAAFELVHESNMSKLGSDGSPVRDEETGKILKGPNYQPPERKIAQMLFSHARHELEGMLNDLKETQKTVESR